MKAQIEEQLKVAFAADAVVEVPLTQLKFRFIADVEVVRMLGVRGFENPVVITEDFLVIGGVYRCNALELYAVEIVPCVVRQGCLY